MAKLKPCPFCGKEVKLFTYKNMAYWIGHQPVKSSKKDITFKIIRGGNPSCNIAFDVGIVKNEMNKLILAWNTRH